VTVGPDRTGGGSARASTRAPRVPINGRVTTTRRRAAGGLRARRVLAVVAAAVLASTVAVAAIPGSPATAAPNPASSATGDNTPAARIATLGAVADGADATLATAVARRNGLEHDLTLAVEALGQAEAATAALNVAAAQAQARYDASRAEVDKVAVAAYIDSSSMSELDLLVNASDPLEAGRAQQLLSRVDDERRRVVAQARADRIAAKQAADAAEAERRRRRDRVHELQDQVPSAVTAVTRAQAAAAVAHTRLDRWLSIRNGTATPILGHSVLTGAQLAAWFRSTRHRARTTIPMDQLAGLYVSEGAAEGVRGDIAFAQSIVETGYFGFPDGGLVAWTDNNFAGIGACDSCAHGHVYPDALTGVRVQMQYLHVYADPTITVARFAHPPVDPNMDQNFRKGQAPTWAGLTHTWATADGYGDAILGVYETILGWVTDHDPS